MRCALSYARRPRTSAATSSLPFTVPLPSQAPPPTSPAPTAAQQPFLGEPRCRPPPRARASRRDALDPPRRPRGPRPAALWRAEALGRLPGRPPQQGGGHRRAPGRAGRDHQDRHAEGDGACRAQRRRAARAPLGSWPAPRAPAAACCTQFGHGTAAQAEAGKKGGERAKELGAGIVSGACRAGQPRVTLEGRHPHLILPSARPLTRPAPRAPLPARNRWPTRLVRRVAAACLPAPKGARSPPCLASPGPVAHPPPPPTPHAIGPADTCVRTPVNRRPPLHRATSGGGRRVSTDVKRPNKETRQAGEGRSRRGSRRCRGRAIAAETVSVGQSRARSRRAEQPGVLRVLLGRCRHPSAGALFT